MVHLIAGSAGGRRLTVPAGTATRPTSARVREALFSRLAHWDALAGAAVLDLYAGSGALGLEAASRGAGSVELVERDRGVARVAAGNAQRLGLTAARVRPESASRYLAGAPTAPFDLVLADPPYTLGQGELADVLALLAAPGWLSAQALVVVERSRRSGEPSWPAGLRRLSEQRLGDTTLWYAEPEGSQGARA
jgi:16S rRNA (guanine966-N2)-methyltransferase